MIDDPKTPNQEAGARILAAFVSAAVVSALYTLPVSVTLVFPRPIPDRVELVVFFAAWMLVPALAWAVFRSAVRLVLLRVAADKVAEVRTFGALLRECFLVQLTFMAVIVFPVGDRVAEAFFPLEAAAAWIPWPVTDAAQVALAFVGVVILTRVTPRRPMRQLLVRSGAVVGAVCITHMIWGALTLATRSQPPRVADQQEVPTRRDTGLEVVVIGIDGADWDVWDAMIAAGNMPHVQAALAKGQRSALLSEHPLTSPRLWATVATGVAGEAHGITTYLAVQIPGVLVFPDHELRRTWRYPFHGILAASATLQLGQVIPVDAQHLRADTLWDYVDAWGGRTNVVNWWVSSPVEPINGNIVSDARIREWLWVEFPLRHDRPLVHPPSLNALVDRYAPPPQDFPAETIARWAPFDDTDLAMLASSMAENRKLIQEPVGQLDWASATCQAALSVARAIHERERADLTLVATGAQDKINHYFLPARFPEWYADVPEDEVRRYGPVVDGFHRFQDGLMGPLLELADEDTVVMVVSDHGHRPLPDNPLSEETHDLQGILLAVGGPFGHGVTEEADAPTIYDVAPTILYLLGYPVPDHLPGHVMTDLMEPAFAERFPVETVTFE